MFPSSPIACMWTCHSGWQSLCGDKGLVSHVELICIGMLQRSQRKSSKVLKVTELCHCEPAWLNKNFAFTKNKHSD